jgi:arginase
MKRTISLFAVPYDSASFNTRMGAGPLHIINGLIKRSVPGNDKLSYHEITDPSDFPAEIATSFRLLGRLREEIALSNPDQTMPIVLSGNCSATVAVVAGLASNETGVIWLDAHGDCETPETTSSGFLDGMGISMLLNKSWQHMLAKYKLISPLEGRNMVLIGTRDTSPGEEKFIAQNRVQMISIDEIRHSAAGTLNSVCRELMRSGIKKIHIHIDVDVIDPLIAHSNTFAVPDGLNKAELLHIIRYCASLIPLSSATIASYDPSCDTDGKMQDLIYGLLDTIINAANYTA